MGKILAPTRVFLVTQEVHVVKNAVRRELHLSSLETRGVQVFQLGLALVVLVHVVALEGHAGVCLVHVNRKLCFIKEYKNSV